jgi:DNA-binding transcriptional regulator YiaG
VAAVTGLVALRRRRRLTQVQLARAVRVDVSTVQRWEHEGRAPRARAIRVAEELGVALTELARPALVAAIPAPVVPPLGRLRRRTHLPVSIVAARVGVSRAALRAWERGTNRPSWPHARALARVLAVAPMEVFDAAGLPAPAHLDPARWTVGELPQILRELRRWRGLTQDQLAATVGVSTATIGAWESGRQRPRRAAMHRLDCALGVAPRLCDLGASC